MYGIKLASNNNKTAFLRLNNTQFQGKNVFPVINLSNKLFKI